MANDHLVLVATSVRYFSQGDEEAFFCWLKRIRCVGEVHGVGRDLLIPLSAAPDDDDLRELIGLFYRYRVDMTQLAVFARSEWASNPKAFWHRRMFAQSA